MRKILFSLFLLLSFSSFGQILEKSVTAVTKLETRGTFVFSSQTIPVLDLTYTQYGTTNVGPWHKVWTALDNYMRFSNDVGVTWHVLRIGGIVYDNGGGTDFVVPNSPITPGTKTKITYDAKGLVTAGDDATTDDIASVTNKRYVTDANLLIVNTPADGSHDGYLKKEDWTRFGDQSDYEYWTLKSGTSGSTTTDTIFTDIKGGLLYNQYAVENAKGIAATGWKVPSIEDFQTLREYIDPAGTNYYPGNAAGGPLKDDDPAYWTAPNTGATNEYGFNGRGNGIRHQTTGVFDLLKEMANYRTTTRVVGNPDPATAYVGALFYEYEGMDVQGWYPGPTTGVSVRLIKDSSPSGPSGTTGVYVGNNGASYPTIVIGTQEWLAADLAETKYRTGGTTIQTIKGGMLYNGFAIDSIANTGWHVPTSTEYLELANALGGVSVAGQKMKKPGIANWGGIDAGATNSSGFSAVGTGTRSETATFVNYQTATILWNGDMLNSFNRAVSQLSGTSNSFITSGPGAIYGNELEAGFSVRLVKDVTTIPYEGGTSTYTGNDGTVYRTVRIGTKEYTAENLIETKFVGGTDIPIVTSGAAWASMTTGAMCAFDNNSSTAVVTTGDAIPMITDNAAWAADVTGAMCAYNNDLTTVGAITTVNPGYGVNVYSKDTVEFIAGENIILSLDGKRLTISATSVPLNDTIVPSTKTKISYDKNGKVTAGADATTADIAPSTDRKYLTDAEKVVIGNTSGTNSGDNAVNTLYDTYINSFAASPSIGYQWTCNSLSGAGYWANTTTPMLFLGVWDANANSPAIADGSGVTGGYYIVGTPGTWNSIAFVSGDQVAYNGLIWQKITGTVYAGLTNNYVPKFDGSKFVNSKLTSNATGVGVNSATPTVLFEVAGTTATDAGVAGASFDPVFVLKSASGTPGIEFRATSASYNTLVGVNAGYKTSTGNRLTVFGDGALASNLVGNYVTVVGAGAAANSIAGRLTSVGYRSSYSLTTGVDNSVVGDAAAYSLTEGAGNSILGAYAAYSATSSSNNAIVGASGLYYNTTGSETVAMGAHAGTYYGSGVSHNTSSTQGVFLGARSRASSYGNTNEIVVGYNSIGHGSNTARWGNTDITNHYFSGKINSDVATGNAPFVVSSTTKVANLNVDQLDGLDSSAFVVWVTAPATKTSTGTVGMIAKDTNYFYICTATNVWKRIGMASNW